MLRISSWSISPPSNRSPGLSGAIRGWSSRMIGDDSSVCGRPGSPTSTGQVPRFSHASAASRSAGRRVGQRHERARLGAQHRVRRAEASAAAPRRGSRRPTASMFSITRGQPVQAGRDRLGRDVAATPRAAPSVRTTAPAPAERLLRAPRRDRDRRAAARAPARRARGARARPRARRPPPTSGGAPRPPAARRPRARPRRRPGAGRRAGSGRRRSTRVAAPPSTRHWVCIVQGSSPAARASACARG